MNIKLAHLTLATVGLLVAAAANAVTITLAGTGTAANGTVLPGGSNDSHYTVSGPGVVGAVAASLALLMAAFVGALPLRRRKVGGGGQFVVPVGALTRLPEL